MFKKILIIIKTGLKVDCKLIEKIKKFSKESKIKVLHFNEVNKNIFKNEDLIITVGGDGTFVKAANLIENSLILGINSNPKKSEGALTSILISESDKLKEILEGKYKIILRQRAKVFLNEKQIDEHAINEVYIGAASQFHTSRYELEFKGKNVLLVDDSIVRGTTSEQIVQMARDAGANKVFFASAAPPVRHPNVYGIDMASEKEFIAHDKNVDQICQSIGADKLIYQDLDDLIWCVQQGNPDITEFDCSCFNGEYVTQDIDKKYLDQIEFLRSDKAKRKNNTLDTSELICNDVE